MTETAPRFRPAFPIVEGKFQVPIARPGTIERTRLVGLLTADPGPPVVAAIAPPGYGKTTLLAQWAALERRLVAWLTLDDLDNDPAVMLSYLARRLRPYRADRRLDPGIARGAPRADPRDRGAAPRVRAARMGDDRPSSSSTTSTASWTGRRSTRWLRSSTTCRGVCGWRSPGGPSRTCPSPGCAPSSDLLEIGPGLLALDEQETTALAAAVGHALSPEEVRDLTTRTEGWAAGIYLAILARGQDAADTGIAVHACRAAIATSRRTCDRSSSAHLPDDDVAFLTRTAILETVTPAARRRGHRAARRRGADPVARAGEPADPRDRWPGADVPLPQPPARLPAGRARRAASPDGRRSSTGAPPPGMRPRATSTGRSPMPSRGATRTTPLATSPPSR